MKIRLIATSILVGMFSFSPAYADPPPILKLSEMKPGTKAVGFSVFKGVEPRKFLVELREVIQMMGQNLILVRISDDPSGGPLEAPLEKIGGIAGMSGSPIMVNCSEYDECMRQGVLVGSLSYRLGNFIVDGVNAALTPAEDLFGSRATGYMAMQKFTKSAGNFPDYSGILKGKLKSLLLVDPLLEKLLDENYSSQFATPNTAGSSAGNVVGSGFSVSLDSAQYQAGNSDIKPGSMISILFAKGDILIPVSGTVTWRDGNLITAFGHPLFNRGVTAYEFYQTTVADTLQLELSPVKLSGKIFGPSGVLFIDGATEVIGEINKSILYDSMQVSVNVDGKVFGFQEEVAPNSEFGRRILTVLPLTWASETFGDMSRASLYYKIVVRSRTKPDIPSVILEDVISASLVKKQADNPAQDAPFKVVLARVQDVLSALESSGSDYSPKEIFVYVEPREKLKVWQTELVFLSKNKAKPGETIHLSILVSEFPERKNFKTIVVPVKIPENIFTDPEASLMFAEVLVQGAMNFTDRRFKENSLATTGHNGIDQINERAKVKSSHVYVQLIFPRTPKDQNGVSPEDKVMSGWRDIDSRASYNSLRERREKDAVLVDLSILEDVVVLNETINLQIVKDSTPEADPAPAVEPKKEKRWFNFLMFWKLF